MDIFNDDEVEVIIPLVEVAATQSLILSEVTSRDDDSSSNNYLVMHSLATRRPESTTERLINSFTPTLSIKYNCSQPQKQLQP